jgi:ribosomal protein S1
VVNEGQELTVRVIEIDPERRRIALGMATADTSATDGDESVSRGLNGAFTVAGASKQSFGTFGDLLSKSRKK